MRVPLVRFLIVCSLILSACTLKVQVSSTLPPVDKLSPTSPSLDFELSSFEKVHFGSTSTPEITWIDAYDDEGGSGISHYEMAVGTKDTLNNVVDWVDVGRGNRASLIVPKLKRGQEYYLALVAVDNAGNRSAPVISPAWQAEPLVADYELEASNININGTVSKILRAPSNERIVVGSFSKYNVNYVGVEGRVNSSGTIENQFYGSDSYKFFSGVVRKAVYQSINSTDYAVIVGDITQVSGQRNSARIYRTKANGDLDASFQSHIGVGFGGGVPNDVVITSDNKILVAGAFTSFKGTPVGRILRLNTDGTLDTSFNVGTGFNATVNSVAVTSSGKIVVGGSFTTLNGANIPRFIVMLNSNGSVDSTFSGNAGSGFDAPDVYAGVSFVGIQSGGQILVGGRFGTYGTTTSMGCTALLNTDGTIDASYRTNIASKMSCGNISKIWELPDASYMYAGSIGYYGPTLYRGILKVSKTTGALDSTFMSNLNADIDNGYLRAAIVDGTKILLMGYFRSVNGDSQYANLTRVNLDGSRDVTFNHTAANGFAAYADSGYKASDGTYRLFGSLNNYGGTQAPDVIKVKADGSVDTGFLASATSLLGGMQHSWFASVLEKYFIKGYKASIASDTTICITNTGAACSVSAFEARVPDLRGFFNDGTGLIVVGHPTIDDLMIPQRLGVNNVADATFDSNFDNVGITDPNFTRYFWAVKDKIVMSGDFIDVGSAPVSGLYRFNIDGTPDYAFNAKVGLGFSDDNGTVFSQDVFVNENNYDIFVTNYANQGAMFNQTPIPHELKFVKISYSGDLDVEFLTNAALSFSAENIAGMTFLPDNRVLVFGDLKVNGIPRNLVRLKANGLVDLDFDAITQITDTYITAVDYDDDDNLLIGSWGTLIFKGQVQGTKSFFKLKAK